jgi:manganese/zinc/iron transport system substrate-binding protein
MSRNVLIALSVLVAGLVVGCTSGGSSKGSGKISVTATTGMVAEIAEKVGGEHVSVIHLMGPGVDPH